MIPFIMPAPSTVGPYPRTGVEMGKQPLASPNSAAAIQWHSQPQPSPSLRAQPPSISALHHADQSSSDVASRSFVEFHTSRDDVDGFNLATTSAISPEISAVRQQQHDDRTAHAHERSVNSHRSILSVSEQAASMPMTLAWPMHPHVLHYAGSSSGDSVRVMSCRHCQNEHYNTAVYSCVERGCNYHVCLACALEQLAAVNEVKRTERDKAERSIAPTINQQQQQQQQQARQLRKGRREDDQTGKTESLMQRWDRPEVGEGELVLKDGDVTLMDVSVVPPVSYSQDRMKREYRSTKQWVRSIEREAVELGLPLTFACSLHADHTLLYHAVSPLPPVKVLHSEQTLDSGSSSRAPTSSTDRYFCDAILSPYCMSHDLNKTLRPVYACPHCGYRLCLPCQRWYLLDLFSRMRATMSYERADEKIRQRMPEYHISREEDSRAIEYAQVMNRREFLWERKRKQGLYVTAISVLLFVVLLNAVITLQDSSVSYQLLNVTLILIGSICAGLLSSALISRLFTSHRLCMSHSRSIDATYLDPSLAYFFDTARIQSIPISALTPKQRDRLSDLYRHHTFVHYQQRTVLWSSLGADLLLWAAIGLLVAAVVVLFVDVVCSLAVYDGVENCAVRAGVPAGVLLVVVLLYPLLFSGMLRTAGWLERKKVERMMYAKEERQRTKWQRRE